MTQQYLRKLTAVLGNASGSAIDFSSLRVTFYVRRGDVQTPNSCDLRIYNVADSTANRIVSEFTQVVLTAGYEGNFGLIFRGTIKQVRKGRVDAKDSYVDVTAADGDEAYNFATMAQSLKAGATPQNSIQAFLSSMGDYSVTAGYAPTLSSNGLTRGRVFYGSTKDELRDFCATQGLTWSIQDGKLTFIPLNNYIPGDAVLITPQTGLIGVPEQTQNGISIRCLLNPSIKIGQLVKLDSTLNLERIGLGVNATANNTALLRSVETNADGLYYCMVVDHRGDTRGNEWYSELTCLSVDSTQIPNGIIGQSVAQPQSATLSMSQLANVIKQN